MMTQNNVLYVFVAKKAQSALPTGDVSAMTDGYVGIAKLDGTLVAGSALGAGIKVRIVRNNGGVFQFSPEFEIGDIKTKTASTYTADSQFLGYLGYNGVSGALEATTDTIYTPKLVVKDSLPTFGNKSFIKEAVYKTSSTSPVYESDVAIGLCDNFIKNMEKEPEKFVDVTVITSAAVTAANAFDHDATVVNGSKSITVGTSLSYNTGAGTLATGDFVRIGSVGGGTALTSNVYKVTEIVSATSFKVDRAVYEASGTYAAATADLEVIPIASVHNSAIHYGLKFIGNARTNFSAGIWKHMVYDFNILQGANFDDVLVTETHGKLGTCTNEGVAEDEWFAQGNRGYGDRVDVIPVASQVSAEMTGAAYNGAYIKTELKQFTNVVGQSPASLVESKIYGVAGLINAVKTVLAIS